LEKENVLVKARNFLVFQGDVETVASQKPKDLTKLIEQVSGSIDLKADYDRLNEEQERAMENSTLYFQKKRGMQSDVKAYKDQKAEADQFESMQAEKDELNLRHLQWKLHHLENDIGKIKENITNKTETRREYNEIQEQLNQQINLLKQEHAETTKDVFRKERLSNKEVRVLEENISSSNHVELLISQGKSKVEKLYLQNTCTLRDIERQGETISDLTMQIQAIEKSLRQLDKSTSSARSKRSKFAKDQEEYQQLQSRFVMESAALQQKIDSYNLSIKAQKDEEEHFKSILGQLDRKLDVARHEHRQGTEKLQRVQEGLDEAKGELLSVEKELETIRGTSDQMRAREQALNEKLTELSNKLLDYGMDKRENEREKSFFELVDELKSTFPGVQGRLSDLCRPTQPKYDSAVTLVLGRNLNAIVTDNQATAMECIRYMREQRKGHANFLPLQDLITKPIPPKYRTFQNARPAIDAISYEKDIEPALLYACGTALIAEDLTIAKHICFEKDVKVKVVTLDGVTIHKSGSMSGSASGGNASGRKSHWEEKEVENVKRAHEKAINDLQELMRARRKEDNREQLYMQANELKARVKHLTSLLDDTSSRIVSKSDEIATLTKEHAEIKRKVDEFDALMRDAEIEQIESEIKEIKNSNFGQFCRKLGIKDIQEFEKLVLRGAAEEEKQRNALENQKSALESTFSYESDHLKTLHHRLGNSQQLIESENQSLADLEAKLKAIKNEVTASETRHASLLEELELLKQKHREKAQAFGKRKSQLNQLLRDREDLERKIAQHSDTLMQLHYQRLSMLHRARVESIPIRLLKGSMNNVLPDMSIQESQNVSESIVVDFKGLDKDLQNDDGSAVDEQFMSKLAQLTSEMERIAPTLRSIDKLSNASAKFAEAEKEFEKARKTARHAKDRFLSVKQERYNRFMDAFQHISGCIDQVYKDLTRSKNFPIGGTAYLTLESDEEPFNEGVKYHAMPPMKRFRDMEQLSGGEKTVAALALLFAIHSYRPSPFFVLDEVDAALDNANVAKVARYVCAARNSVQFLVISLKSSFYENAQALVGVYRDVEKSTSSILTLDVRIFDQNFLWLNLFNNLIYFLIILFTLN
jgi:structural maintenance of chromosome 1